MYSSVSKSWIELSHEDEDEQLSDEPLSFFAAFSLIIVVCVKLHGAEVAPSGIPPLIILL